MSFLCAFEAQALEASLLYGPQSYSRLDGCCISNTPSSGGVGVDLRIKLEDSQWQVFGFSDRKWSELAILKPIYLVGGQSIFDPSHDGDIEVRRVSNWKLVFSYGLGYFVHSTRTVKFDLPALTSGMTILGQLSPEYAVHDNWSVTGLVRFGAGITADDRGIINALMLGVLYRY